MMSADQIGTEAAAIARQIAAHKERAMIYQADSKEHAARLYGLPLDSFYDLPYWQWECICHALPDNWWSILTE